MTNDPKRVTTGIARLSYEHLTKPWAANATAEPKYGVTVLIPKTDAATKQAIDNAVSFAIEDGVNNQKVWNGRRPMNLGIPVYDGDGFRKNGEPFGDECKGHWVFTASSKERPKVYDANLQEILDPTQIYSGMYARVCVRFYAFSKAGNNGVAGGLEMVQKVQEGEPLSGSRITAEEAFGQPPAYMQPGTGTAPFRVDPITGLPM